MRSRPANFASVEAVPLRNTSPMARTRCAASTTTTCRKPSARPSSSVAECRNTTGPEVRQRPKTIWCSVIGWRKDWVRPAPGVRGSKPEPGPVSVPGVTLALRAAEGDLGRKTAAPTAETTRAAPAAATAPRTPPPMTAEAAAPAAAAMKGMATGISQPSRRWCRQ